MSVRLSNESLGGLSDHIVKPQYRRDAIKSGIVHLGVGAFHRAHQAWYTEQVLNREPGDWGIVGVSLRRPEARDQLQPQDGLYTVVERDGEQLRCQVVGAIKQVLVAPEDPQALIKQLAQAEIKLITLTITEKGYCYDAASGGLKLDHPDVQRDIEQFPENPTTAIGFLVASLAQRAASGRPGVTLLSCDNLSHNGRILQKVVLDFAARVDPSLPAWIKVNVSFPCSMVDRIVPATTVADLSTLQQILGVRDEAAVFTEPFSQWVVEDNFIRGAPDWQRVGVLFTDDVTPFETMKLRLLNGSHSLIAYLGFLAGYDYVHEVMADKDLERLVRLYMDAQAQPTLKIPQGFNIEEYKAQLCQRFANSALNHRTYQIAQDGSQKIPQRWLASVRTLANKGQSTMILALAVAGWIHYLEGRRDNGEAFDVDDPLAKSLRLAVQDKKPCQAVMEISSIFGDMLFTQEHFVAAVSQCYQQIKSQGVKATVQQVLKQLA